MESSNEQSMDLEPSEEFPILFGLLTESKKRSGWPPARTFQNSLLRRAMLAPSKKDSRKSVNVVDIAEPDSSTVTEEEQRGQCSVRPLVDLRRGSVPDDPSKSTSDAALSASSPLLILRLTSTKTVNRRYPRCRRNELPLTRPLTSKVISDDEECTPTSTTSDGDLPVKRLRSNSLPSDDDTPHLDPMVPTSSTKVSPAPVTATTAYRSEYGSSCTTGIGPLSLLNSSSSSSTVFYSPEARSYKCNFCDLKFKRQFHLLRHLAVHEEKQRQACCHCNTAFYRRDNLLVHQSKCKQRLDQGHVLPPRLLPTTLRPSRPPPRTLADLLDRDYDRECDHGRSSANTTGSYFTLPSELEISEIMNEPVTTPPRCRVETMKVVEFQEDQPVVAPQGDEDVVELFPCRHCHEVYPTFSRLLKHTASRHITNPTDGTFHFEIETILNQ